MPRDAARGEAPASAHPHTPSTAQHEVECQPEHEQDGAAQEISLPEETDHRDRVHCRDGQRDLDDPGPGLGAIEVERQVHRYFGKRASLARLALPVQRLVGWNLTAVL